MASEILALILTLKMLALPGPWYHPGKSPETYVERRDRIAMITRVVVSETAESAPVLPYDGPSRHVADWAGWSHQERATAVLVKMWNESARFRLDVHQGRTRGDDGASTCLGQIMRGGWVPKKWWASLSGTDAASTRRCVRTVYVFLGRHASRCLGEDNEPTERNLARVYAGYGSGYSCNPRIGHSRQRAGMWARMIR